MKQVYAISIGWMLAVTIGTAAEWTQWRGPDRAGFAPPETPAWPESLEGALSLKWEAKLDNGYPGPIVSEDLIFTVETKDKKYEVVRAFSRETGEQKWEHQWAGKMSVPFFARSNGSWVRSTPAYDGEFLYVGGMRDVLVCIRASDGEEMWKVDFPETYDSPNPGFGLVCSPLIDGDALYLQAGASFVKLNKKTGEEIWRTMKDGGGMWGSVFSSPTMTTLHGKKQLLVQSRTTLAGIDEATGEELWSTKVEAFRGMNILTPMLYENSVFTAPYGGRAQRFDVAEDGTVSEKWNNKLQGYMSSPLIIDDHVYLHLRNQRFVCVALSDGEIKWTSPRGFGKYMSLVANGDKILALDERGSLFMFRANPEAFEQLGEFEAADEQAWAHLAVADNEVIVRSQKSIKVFEWAMPKLSE